jgi:hypothetical protein
MKKFRIFLLLFILIQLVLPAHVVFADTGPKPSMEFEFKQGLPEGQVTITSGILYECEQSDCSDAAPLEELGPQRFTCDALGCSALAYGFSDYHRLEIQFSDGKTRQSNIFKTAGFDSKYTVTIQPDDLLVEEQFSLTAIPPTWLIVMACVCVLVIGAVIIGLIIFLVRHSRKK